MQLFQKESGRSMVEMILVIGIISLLIIGGLYSLRVADTKIQIKSVSERLISLRNQRILSSKKESGRQIFTDKEGPFGSVLIIENGTGEQNKDYFWITVKKKSATFCNELLKIDVGAVKVEGKNCPEEATFYFLKNPDADFLVIGNPDKEKQARCPTGYYDSESACPEGEQSVAHELNNITCYTCEPITCNADLISQRYCSDNQCKQKMCCPDNPDCSVGSCASCANGPHCTQIDQHYCEGTLCKTKTCCSEDADCEEGSCSNCCTNNIDCTDFTNPKCDTISHICVPCLESEKQYPKKLNSEGCCVNDTSKTKQCPSEITQTCNKTCSVCRTDGTCACTSNSDCTNPTPVCDTVNHVCVPCLESQKQYPKKLNSVGCCVDDTSQTKQCPSQITTTCSNTCSYCKTDGTCGCTSNSNCTNPTPVCDTVNHICVLCLESQKQYPKKLNSVGCCVDDTSQTKQCPSQITTTCSNTCSYCKTDGTCGCVSNNNCPPGQICQSGSCITPECWTNTDCHSTSDACPTCSNYRCSFTYEATNESCCTSHGKRYCASNSYWDRCVAATECCANDKPTDACASYYTCSNGTWTKPENWILCSVKSGRRTTTDCYSTDEYKLCSDGTTCVAKNSCCDADKPMDKPSECYMCNDQGEWVFNPNNYYPAECGCPDDAPYSCSCFLPMVQANFKPCNNNTSYYCFTIDGTTITYHGSMSVSRDLDISSCNLIVQDASNGYRADLRIGSSAKMKVKNVEMTTSGDSGSTLEINNGSSLDVSNNLTLTNATMDLWGKLNVNNQLHITSTTNEINDEAIEGGSYADLHAGSILIDSQSRRDAIDFPEEVYIYVSGNMTVNSAVDLGGFDIGGKLTITYNPIAYGNMGDSLLSITTSTNTYSDPSYIRRGADIGRLNLGASLYVTGGDLKVTAPNYFGVQLFKDITLSVSGSIVIDSWTSALNIYPGSTVSAGGSITATCTADNCDGIVGGANGGIGDGANIYNTDCSKDSACSGSKYATAKVIAAGDITGWSNSSKYGGEGIDVWCADFSARKTIGKSNLGNGMRLYKTTFSRGSYVGNGGKKVESSCTRTYTDIVSNCSTPPKNTTYSVCK